jgi:hypothetical protein
MPGSNVYERMEYELRGRVGPAPMRQRMVEAVLLVLLIFILGYLLYVAQFSGTVRWFLGFAVIAAIAGFAWSYVARRTAEPAPLLRPAERPRIRTGELRAFEAVVRRANQGLTYSQVAVTSRARDAFAERTRLARGMSPEAMRHMERDPAALRATYRDAALEDFLFLPSSDTEQRYRWVWQARRRGRFDVEFHDILDRMEAWR